MEGHIETICLSQFSRKYDKMLPAVKVENLVAPTFGPVFLDDPQRNLQQPDCRGRICFFAPYMKPPRSVGGLRDVLIRELVQVGVGQAREGGEEEPVPNPLKIGFVDGRFHQLFEIFEFEVAALAFGQLRVQPAVRIAAERTLADSPFGHFLQAVQVFVHRLLHHIALRSQKEVEVVVERFVEASERDVFLPAFLLYERSQVVVRVLVAGIGLFRPIYADPFVKLCIVFPEQGQQRERLLSYAFYGVLHQFRRDEAEVVANPPIVGFDLFGQQVDGPIYFAGVGTPAVRASCLRIPQRRFDGGFDTYMSRFGVDADFAQELAGAVLADFSSIDIE